MSNTGPTKMYTLTGADGEAYQSPVKGAFGGNRGTKVYGLMTCKTAARYVAAGTYQKSRVFFCRRSNSGRSGLSPVRPLHARTRRGNCWRRVSGTTN
jgi:hypothetical protein